MKGEVCSETRPKKTCHNTERREGHAQALFMTLETLLKKSKLLEASQRSYLDDFVPPNSVEVTALCI